MLADDPSRRSAAEKACHGSNRGGGAGGDYLPPRAGFHVGLPVLAEDAASTPPTSPLARYVQTTSRAFGNETLLGLARGRMSWLRSQNGKQISRIPCQWKNRWQNSNVTSSARTSLEQARIFTFCTRVAMRPRDISWPRHQVTRALN